jgi:tRNA pseudouridine38-40 synthase
MRVKVHLSYDGTNYFGWQKQPEEDHPTVQNQFELALKELTNSNLKTQGSGRTDRGVHALDQVVHFDLPTDCTFENFDWIRGLNRFLPSDIRVRAISKVAPDFHATRSALSKTYVYQIQDGPSENPLISRYSHWLMSPVDLDYMTEISKPLLGTHDFSSFQTVGTELYSTTRTLTAFEWTRVSEHLIQVSITGDGFLKQMVRNLMGTLLHQYWKKPFKSKDMQSLIEKKDRSKAYGTAPAKGLILYKVHYPLKSL